MQTQEILQIMNQFSNPMNVFAMAGTDNWRELAEKQHELNQRCQVIQASADAEGRPLTSSEQREIDDLYDEFQNLDRRRKIAEQTEGLSRSQGRLAGGVDPENIYGRGPGAAHAQREIGYSGVRPASPMAGLPRGFRHYGEFFAAVRDSSRLGGTIDGRLGSVYNAPSQFSQEGVGTEGGFAVPTEWAAEIMELVTGEASMLGLMNVMPVTGNTYIQPTDQRAPWDNTGGVRAYWGAEGGQYTPTSVDLKANTKRLCKLTALVPVTEELLEDYGSLDAYLRQKVGMIFDFQIKFALIQGGGVGQPLGILNAPCLITVPKLSNQAASTIIFQNVLDMWSQLIPGSETRCFWLATKRAQEQLMKMFIPIQNAAGTDNVSGLQVYIPMGSGISGTPYDRLMGRPVLYSEACNALGTPGDLILVDGGQYGIILKTAGLMTQVSIHLWFDYGITAYRFHIRIDGAPFLSAPVLSRDGSTEYSPFLALAQRS